MYVCKELEEGKEKAEKAKKKRKIGEKLCMFVLFFEQRSLITFCKSLPRALSNQLH